MKHFNLHSVLNSIILISVITTGIIYFSSSNKSIAYIDNVQLFNQFNMTNDIKTIEEKNINDKVGRLDSIYGRLKLEKNQKSDLAKQLIKQLNEGRVQLEAMKNNYESNLSQNVWNRLNTYIEEYSEKKQIDIVFGVNGNGNVMYAEDAINITDDLLEYSNNKYEGH